MPRLNNDERYQDIRMLNAGMSATIVLCSTLVVLERLSSVTGNVADRLRSGRPRVSTAADDRYISTCSTLQRQASDCSSNQKTVWYLSTGCQKSVETKRSTYSCIPTVLGQILTRRHRTARRDRRRRHLHFRCADWDLILFSD